MKTLEPTRPEAEPFKPDWRILVALGLVLAATAFVFFDLVEDMAEDPLVPMDAGVFAILQSLRTPFIDTFMIGITELGDTWVVIAVTAAILGWLLYKKAWRAAVFWLTAVSGASAINTAIKGALERPRPIELYLNGASAWSFPSGHSTVNFVLYGFLSLLILRCAPTTWRIPFVAATAMLVVLIGFSRLYLGAHWLSDVGGGFVFGSMWLALLGLFYMYRQAEPLDARGLALTAIVALAVAGGINIAINHARDTIKYRVQTACGVEKTLMEARL